MPSAKLVCARLLALSVIVGSLVAADEAAAQVNVVFSCPLYDPASGDGNNPSMPQDPQATPMDVSGAKPLLCQVLYGNVAGAPLTNVRFTLRAAQLNIPYVDPAVLPGGDPMITQLFPTANALNETRFAPLMNQPQPGFPAGVWSSANGTYTWTLPTIAPGQTGELRVGMGELPPMLPGQRLNMTLDVQIDGGPVIATRTVPFELPASRFFPAVVTLDLPGRTTRPNLTPRGDLAGRAFVPSFSITGANGWRADYDREVIIALPWFNSGTNNVSAVGFNGADPSHVRLHDPAQLQAALYISSSDPLARTTYAYYAFGPGQSGAPASGPNQGAVLRYDAATNTLRARIGAMGLQSLTHITWRAPLRAISLPINVGALSTRVCITSRALRAARPAQPQECLTTATTLTDNEDIAPAFLHEYNGNSWLDEARAVLPYSTIFMRVGGGYNTSRVANNVRLFFQLPGDTQRRARFVAAYAPSYNLTLVPDPRPLSTADAIYVSTRPSGYGSFADLTARAFPASLAADWRRCDDAIAGQTPGLRCEAAHLAAIGVNPDDVTEVRFDAARFDPLSLLHGIYQVATQLDGTAQSSIDGVTPTTQLSMVGASVGSTYRIEHTSPAGVATTTSRGNWAEVQGGSLFGFGIAFPYGAPTTTEVRGGFILPIQNRGPGPVYGPITLRVTLPPVGFDYDNSPTSPAEPQRPILRWSWHVDQVAPREQFFTTTVPDTAYTYTWDPVTKELVITLDLSSVGGYLNGNLEPGLRPLNVPSDIVLTMEGIIRIGAPRFMPLAAVSVTAEVTNPDGTRSVVTRTTAPLPSYNVTSVAPALALSGLASPDPAPGYGPVTLDYTVSNAAYQANGARIPNGATGSARGVALIQRITRDGDFGLTGRSVFVSASSPDAGAIWVRTTEPMMGQKGDASSLTAANGWVFCAMAGMPCDAQALASAGISPAAIRWVAFDMGEVLVTDAEPRGAAPLGGAQRVERPYTAQIVVLEDGSPQGAILRASAEVLSQDTAPATTAEMELDVVVNAECDLRDPTRGPNAPELCDGIDNDCDGQTDEDFPTLGTLCSAGLGACRNEALIICAQNSLSAVCPAVAGEPQGPEVCDGMDNTCDGIIDEGFVGLNMSCIVDGGGGCMVPGAGACSADGTSVVCAPMAPSDMDDDGYLDVCDCAPGDNARFTMTPGAASSCDVDGDGACAGDIVGPNPAICLVVGDCDDDDAARYPGASELCDGVDNDCSGLPDEPFAQLGLGMDCTVGQGACGAQGRLVCDGDGVACDAEASAPSEEVCDEVDNDCDGEVDEREDGSSLCDPQLPTSYDVSGDGLVSCQSVPARPARSLGWLGLVGLLVCARRMRGLKGVRG